MYKILYSLVFVILPLGAMQQTSMRALEYHKDSVQLAHTSHAEMYKIKASSMMASHRLGNVALYHDKNGFHVEQDGKPQGVKRYDVDPVLRNISKQHLKAFLKSGYISIGQMNNGDFSLKANVRGPGGSIILSGIAYSATKSLCYGAVATAVGAVGAGIVASGGALAPALGGAVAVGSGVATAGAASSVGAVVVAGAIGSSTAATAAVTTGTMYTMIAAGGWAATVAAIECLAVAAGALGAMVPGPI